MSIVKPMKGQRWVSDSEPELGLGIILKAQSDRAEVFFPAANGLRTYALQSAPLRRVEFKEGDRIKTHEGAELVVEGVEVRDGLLVYKTSERELPESELSDTISFSKPEDRLVAGQVDDLMTFDLRVESLHRRCEMRKSPVRGFAGGRVELIPHQIFIAGEVASRLAPRVLLADEVGLGKTIEAGLILHRLNATGRAERILILVPEPLIHQWFVEMLRRFNLLFSLFDEERCNSISQHDPDANPFLDSQLVICSVGFLSENPLRAGQALAAGWDLIVVDEAHHLEWSAAGVSPQYSLVESLAKETRGLLLLTATPQQLGPEGHFARLRLLDPERYANLDHFLEETGHYEQVAQAVDRLLGGAGLSKRDQKLFADKSGRIRRHSEELARGEEVAREQLVGSLLDEFGTGRVMFRNTRAVLSGFPERKAILIPLEKQEPKLKWLVRLLKQLSEEKVLLICRSRELAVQIHEGLQREVNIACALFHEGLTLLQRDRNAAFFAEEGGARILICSEIGSEGRNFQFAHHLVLFDLPHNPELLEQRIGRLDRIGQTEPIKIHVPYDPGTGSEVLARWYHEGLNAFEKNPHGASEIAHELAADLSLLKENFDARKLSGLIRQTQTRHAALAKKLERGNDRLLALNSCKPEQAASGIRLIRELDADLSFEEYLLRLLDHFGLNVEELGQRSYLFTLGHLRTDAFPSLPEGGMSVTFSRERALIREDLGFMSRDHPLVRAAIDLILASESGNAAFGVWKDSGSEAIILEIHAVVECVAPASVHADRFLPATPVRIAVDHALIDQTADPALLNATLEKGEVRPLLDKSVVKKKFLPSMLEKAQALAEMRMREIVEAADTRMSLQLQEEIERLEDLRTINDHVRPEEIAALRQHHSDLRLAIGTARLRLDALRLIMRVP